MAPGAHSHLRHCSSRAKKSLSYKLRSLQGALSESYHMPDPFVHACPSWNCCIPPDVNKAKSLGLGFFYPSPVCIGECFWQNLGWGARMIKGSGGLQA